MQHAVTTSGASFACKHVALHGRLRHVRFGKAVCISARRDDHILQHIMHTCTFQPSYCFSQYGLNPSWLTDRQGPLPCPCNLPTYSLGITISMHYSPPRDQTPAYAMAHVTLPPAPQGTYCLPPYATCPHTPKFIAVSKHNSPPKDQAG